MISSFSSDDFQLIVFSFTSIILNILIQKNTLPNEMK